MIKGGVFISGIQLFYTDKYVTHTNIATIAIHDAKHLLDLFKHDMDQILMF